MSIKHVSLVVLTVQNSALILTMRYSRILPGDQYRPTTAVILSEILKTLLSFIILISTRSKGSTRSGSSNNIDNTSNRDLIQQTNASFQNFLTQVLRDIFSTKNGFLSILLPAVLYTVQNNLQYIAASNLDAATFQTTYQAKVLATAFFAVIILRQIITYIRWIAIIILTVGVTLISHPTAAPTKTGQSGSSLAHQPGNRTLGLLAVAAACLFSGFTGVYLEYLLKKVRDSQTQTGASMLWTRNVQLCMASIGVATIAAISIDGSDIWRDGFFFGYNSVVWATILLQAGGGLIVALVITYADNILKTFATTISTIISTTVSVMMGDCVLTTWFASGVVLVLVATNLYGASGFFFGGANHNHNSNNSNGNSNHRSEKDSKQHEKLIDDEEALRRRANEKESYFTVTEKALPSSTDDKRAWD